MLTSSSCMLADRKLSTKHTEYHYCHVRWMSRELWRPRSLHQCCSMPDNARITWTAWGTAVRHCLCTSNSCNTCHPRCTHVKYHSPIIGMTVLWPAWLFCDKHDCFRSCINVIHAWTHIYVGHEAVMPVMTHRHWVSFEQSGCNLSTCMYVCTSCCMVPSRAVHRHLYAI